MKALRYLLLTILKNKLLQLKKKPALLILYAVCMAWVVFSIITGLIQKTPIKANNTPIEYLYAIVAAIGMLYLYTFTTTGLSKGGTFFNMADVSLLFCAPISSKKILIYGLLKQLGTTFLTSIFILYQIPNIINTFGIERVSIVFYILLIYAIMLFFCQLISIAVYIYTNQNGQRKNQVKIVLGALFACIAILAYLGYSKDASISGVIKSVMNHKIFYLIPVAGWSVMFLQGIVSQSAVLILLPLAFYIILGTLVIRGLANGKADYYEDVLCSTETTFAQLQAYKEGKNMQNWKNKIKVKENVTGINKGQGATAIFYRQILERKRKSRLIFIDKSTIVIAAIVGVTCYVSKNAYMQYTILGVLSYIGLFTTMFGNMSFELKKPYIFMLPEKPIKKLFYACLINYIEPFMDGAIIFTVSGIILKSSPLFVLMLVITYGMIFSIFTSITLFWQKIFGQQPNRLVAMMIELLVLICALTPGIILTVFLTITLDTSLAFVGLLPIVVMSFLASAILFFISRNIFVSSDYIGK